MLAAVYSLFHQSAFFTTEPRSSRILGNLKSPYSLQGTFFRESFGGGKVFFTRVIQWKHVEDFQNSGYIEKSFCDFGQGY